MAGGGERGVLTLGGKGNSLSPASVFEFAKNQRSPPKIRTEPCLSSSGGGGKFQFSIPNFLTPVETRACLVVLVNKLVIVSSSSSPPAAAAAAACSHLLDALNNQDFSTTATTTIVDVDEQVHQVLSNCWPDAALLGICSLLDYESFALSTLADAVASLSCEALRADVSSFNSFIDSGDGSSAKDSAAVASDLKVLLNGSKLLGNLRFHQISNIPRIHGCLRSVARSVHSATRVDLNSVGGTGEDLVSVLSSLALALQNLGKTSWSRSKLCFDSLVADITTNHFFSGLVDSFNANCPSIRDLDDSIKSFLAAYLENDYVRSLHLIHALSDLVRKILSWEATASFVMLEVIDLITNPLGTNNLDTSKGNPKTEKKRDKRKKVMGKGTAVFIQYLKDMFQFEKKTAGVVDTVLLQKLADDFLSLFDLEDPGFESLLQKVKDIVDSNESRRLPKLPKGTRDFAKEQMAVRERAFTIIGEVFKRHGAMALDTPVFELRETLTGKYGEDSKLIYDLADQGGELCSLRYDLTVPFARYVAMNGLTSFRRYQMAKVYRRDNPSKGRYREFYQCDFDIAGDETVGADFEVIKILTELLNELKIGDYEIKLNHRKLLDGMLDICGVPSDKVRTICSSIDKLDKYPSFEPIKREMVDEKGLNVKAAEKIGCFVELRGHPLKLMSELKKEGSEFLENIASRDALKDLEKLFEALEKARCLDKVVLDMSLARGLDYYTGVIYEAVFKGATQVGSIAAGGRYDNLIGMFGTKRVPAIGVSLGIERVFTIMEQLQKDQNQAVRATETQVLVSILGDDISLAAEIVSECWEAKLKAEFMVHKRVTKHFDRAKESRIPWMVIIGERELSEGVVKLKDMVGNREDAVPRSKYVEELVKRLSICTSS